MEEISLITKMVAGIIFFIIFIISLRDSVLVFWLLFILALISFFIDSKININFDIWFNLIIIGVAAVFGWGLAGLVNFLNGLARIGSRVEKWIDEADEVEENK